jgi:hypothetical protein
VALGARNTTRVPEHKMARSDAEYERGGRVNIAEGKYPMAVRQKMREGENLNGARRGESKVRRA